LSHVTPKQITILNNNEVNSKNNDHQTDSNSLSIESSNVNAQNEEGNEVVVVAKKRRRGQIDPSNPTPKKTRTERNKERKLKIEKLVKLKQQQLNAYKQKMNRLSSIIRSFTLQHDKEKLRLERMKQKKLKWKPKHPMTKEKIDVPLMSELSQSLRSIQPTNPVFQQFHRNQFRSGLDIKRKRGK